MSFFFIKMIKVIPNVPLITVFVLFKDDPVANIRFCVASLFGTLKQMLVLPDDQILFDRLNDVFQKFNEEKDRDALEIYRRKMEEIKRPNLSFNKEEHEKEQKRRREEEDKIMSGGKGSTFLGGKKPANKRKYIN